MIYIKGGNKNLIDDMQQYFNVLCQTDSFVHEYSDHSLVSGKCNEKEINICKIYVLPHFLLRS